MLILCACIFPPSTSLATENWTTLDDFSHSGVLGHPNWSQPTPFPNCVSDGDRLHVPGGRGVAILNDFPSTEDPQRIRFLAYGGGPSPQAQYVSALLGFQDLDNYYEVRIVANYVDTGDFYRLFFYRVSEGVQVRDAWYDLSPDLDAVELEVWLAGPKVSARLHAIDPITKDYIGSPWSYSFNSVPSEYAERPRVGLAAFGPVQIDDVQGFVIPEPGLAILTAVAGLWLWRRDHRRS
ncbi:MAG: hypothetical protein HY718_18470 [Planctomycetes bacterium]|nr:hypothetical protein [Planctomycetota bacterium]